MNGVWQLVGDCGLTDGDTKRGRRPRPLDSVALEINDDVGNLDVESSQSSRINETFSEYVHAGAGDGKRKRFDDRLADGVCHSANAKTGDEDRGGEPTQAAPQKNRCSSYHDFFGKRSGRNVLCCSDR